MTAGRTHFRWLVLFLVVVSGGVSYMFRTNVSVLGDSMMGDLGLNEIQLGMVFSAFAAGYAIFQFPSGVFGEAFGARFTMAAAAVVWGGLTIVTAVVPGTDAASVGTILGILVVTRFLVGVAHAPVFPVGCGGVISRWFPPGSWGLPNGLSSTGLTLGAAATGPLLVWLMEIVGWRGAFLVSAPLAFVFAIVWWFAIRNNPAEHPLVGSEELDVINAGRLPESEKKQHAADWRRVIRNRDVLLLTISYFCANYIFFLFFNWFFFYLVDVKMFSAKEAGALMAALWVIGAIGATIGGFACDRVIARFGFRWGPGGMCGISLVLASIFLVTGALADDPHVAVVLLCICFGLTQITEAPYWATTIAIAEKHAAAATGVLNTGGNVVGFVGGMLVPFTASKLGWVAAISTGAVFALIGAVLWFVIRGDRRMDGDPEGATTH